MSMTISTEEKIKHYQRSIDRSIEDKNRLLHCIEVLSKLPVTVQHLQTTGIGRTVNALRKIEDGVGDAAKRLVTKWKIMVANTDTSEEEDEACVPDVPESYESPDCNSDTEDTLRKKIRNSDNVQPEALQRTATLSPPMELNIEDSPPNIPYIPNNDKEELDSDEEKLSYNTSESKKEHESRSSSHSSKHSSKSSSKDKNSSKDSRSKSSSHKDKHVSHKDKYESSKSSKHSKSSEDNEHKRKDKSKSKSDSSSSTSSSYKEEKKRKFESSSSEGESDKKKRKISSSDEGEEDEEDEENNFVINEMEPSEKSEEEEEEEEKDYKESKTKEKESSRHDTSHSDKKKSKNKHHSSSSKTKSHESNSKSKKDKSSNSKSDERGKDEKRKDNDHHSKDSSKSKSSHSSSSSKDHSKDKDKNEHKDKDKHSKDKKKESNDKNHKDSKEKSNKDDKGKCKEIKEHKESKEHKEHKEHKDHKENKKHKEHKEKESKDSNVNKKSKKLSKDLGGGIDCNSGTSFADALGMCTMPPPSKKKKESNSVNLTKSSKLEQPSSSVSTPSSSKSPLAKTKVEPPDSPESLPLLSSNIKLEPLKIDEEVNLASTLPEPSPYYKPLPQLNPAQRRQNEDEMLSQVIYAKNQRTKVYSGNKSGWTNVPSLYEMCIRVLIENIDALEFTGGVPYYIIKPILERASPDQLFMLEHHNPYIIEDSDPLWQFHCNKDFRTKQREEMESWREMYMRCLDEREAKLKALTANIKQSIDKSQPVRSAKLAYVDNVVKPPRSVLRKQAKYGTANATSKASDTKKKILAAASGAGTSTDSSTEKISVPPPPAVRVRPPSTHAIKKTKAPLMAMALKAIKGRYKR